MRRTILIAFILSLIYGNANAVHKIKHKANTKITCSASFPGGTEELLQYLHDNIRYPLDAREENVEGRVTVRFVINEEGNCEQPVVLRGISKSCDNEALRVVRGMPTWLPAMYKGRKIKSVYMLPVVFRLE